MRYASNSIGGRTDSIVMYVDMNSFFASCEQQDNPELRDRPIGVCPFASPTACIIAPSVEAKKYGVKTGMRLYEARILCPHILPISARPFRYRYYHVEIMKVLNKYCADTMARSIDEAVMNLTSYKLVYKDMLKLARDIKEDIRLACGDYVKCSIGIAPNSFLAKLGTELQKPDGLVWITPDNIDEHLKKLKLTDLPGIARGNEKRLNTIGINSPLEMRHSSEALLRKAFGGVVGNYWHARLNFKETDLYKNPYKAMSAARTVSRQQRESKQSLESLLISLCTRLEQRMVKQAVFCRQVSFSITYRDQTGWDTRVKLQQPLQDAVDMRRYIMQRMHSFEHDHRMETLLTNNTRSIGVHISDFVSAEHVQYSLFDNKIRFDLLRKTMYHIKDRYGKNVVRKASETIEPHAMRDAIGFGSVKDLYEGDHFNKYLLEDDEA